MSDDKMTPQEFIWKMHIEGIEYAFTGYGLHEKDVVDSPENKGFIEAARRLRESFFSAGDLESELIKECEKLGIEYGE